MRIRSCLLCVSGMMPAYISPIFGPVYRACPHCHTRCLDCDGTAVFPAITGLAAEAVFNAVFSLGYDTVFCDRCVGIIGVDRLPLWPNQTSASTSDNCAHEDQADTIHRVENVLRNLVDDYYAAFTAYLAMPANPVIDRALIRARLTAIAETGDRLAEALGVVAPDWELMRDLAKHDPWADHPEPGVNP